MSLLHGAVSIARFHIRAPKAPDFEAAAFVPIPSGDEENVPRREGLVSMKGDAPFEIGAKRWAGRLRIDEIKPDPTVLKDRYEELLQAELDAGAEGVGKLRRKELKKLAIAECVIGVQPSRKYVEWVIDGSLLYGASTSRSDLGCLMGWLRRAGFENILPAAPWDTLPTMASTVVDPDHPGQSVWGCRYLREILGESGHAVTFEVEDGRVVLQGPSARITIAGEIWSGLVHHLHQGAEPLAAKVFAGDAALTLDALSWWVRNASIPDVRAEHWTEALDGRLQRIVALFETLDAAFGQARPLIEKNLEGDERTFIQESLPELSQTLGIAADAPSAKNALRAALEAHEGQEAAT